MGIIETHRLTRYYGRSRGIVDVDLGIAPGEIFGFIGPDGAGKSTTIRSPIGLITPSRGRGTIFGLDIIRDSKEIKKRVGYLPGEVEYCDRMSGVLRFPPVSPLRLPGFLHFHPDEAGENRRGSGNRYRDRVLFVSLTFTLYPRKDILT